MISLGQIAQENGKNLTPSSAAWVLSRFPCKQQWHFEQEVQAVCDLVAGAQLSLGTAVAPGTRKDTRAEEVKKPADLNELYVSTDYDFAYDSLKEAGIKAIFQPLAESTGADRDKDVNFLFVAGHIKNFYSVDKDLRVNQFPYEGGLVRKVRLTSSCFFVYSSRKHEQNPYIFS